MTNFKKTGPTGNRQPVAPPRWARHFLEWYCRPELMEDLQGDLNEYFERNLKTKGTTKAKLIYVIDVFKFLRPYTIKKIQLSEAMYDLIVFQNYFKTSLRNIARNKLFSAINIAGLAIAMSVGLLLIALITELRSFDSFHKNAARIYRVNNILDGYNYATTSVLTWRKIKETVSGIDQVTIVRRGLYEDLHYQDKVVPLRGLWADENFFRIFSFDLISGNAATALKEPNAIVLTRSSALKLFGETDVAGKLVQIDSTNYAVTGVVNDPPLNSHMRFEMLCSFISIDAQKLAEQNREWMQWNFMWANYVYVLLPEENDRLRVEKSLAQISEDGNKTIGNSRIDLYLEPLHEIALARNISNSLGPTVERSAITTLGVFALVVILFACFNYTNLSIARALRRTREVGIRKVVGASRRQVFIQFVFESVILSMLALAFSFGFFILLRGEFVSMNRAFSEMVTLKPTAEIYAYFLGLALLVGILAGLFPAVLFSKINAARVLKDLSSVKLFGHVNLRKGLIVFQYTLSILFIVPNQPDPCI